MKGLYMVDADRGFVQYFENLLFTHSEEYKMLGHNFKANEFLLKIKERPDLLDKIDLLFINPKLNDLNGLELYKKIQSKRKDINVCILVNENIKTFYENDIAELGIDNVILYPNNDEYYLESVRQIFEKIENKNKFNLVGQNNTESKRDVLSDKDLFSELNSDDFLSQFDFDSLTSDMFSKNSGDDKKEELKKEEPKNVGVEDMEGYNNYAQPNIGREAPLEYTDYNNSSNNGGFSESVSSFVTPNFGFEDDTNKTNDIFGFDENELKNNAYENKTYENPSFDFNSIPNTESKFSFEEPYNQKNQSKYGFEEPYSPSTPYNPNGIDNGSNPLDLSAFGVGLNKNENLNQNGFNIFESPELENKPSNDDIFNNSNSDNKFDLLSKDYGNSGYLNMDKPNAPDFLSQPVGFDVDDFEAPYENRGINQKSNLQNINRPDIDSIDNFSNYGEKQGFESGRGPSNPNSQVGYDRNLGGTVNPTDIPTPNMGRHAGFNNPNVATHGLGLNEQNNNAGGFQGFNETVNKPNPYDEYLNLGKKAEEPKNIGYNNYPNPNNFAANKVDEKPFGGFDFGKTQKEESPFGVNGASEFRGNPMSGGPTPVGGYPSAFDNLDSPKVPFEDDAFNNTSNKAYIENMYNKAGVEDLNYAPTAKNNPNMNPIRHERTADSSYSQVPDFARQVVAFYSTKGGIGKTSLAVNATIQLAKYSKKKICLIDFDLTNANVHTHLGILDSTYDLSVVSNFESEIDSFSLSRIVTPYRVKDKNGETVEFDVIVGFKEMKMAQRFSEKEVYKILSILEEMYDVVVVDTHPVYTDLAVSTILKKATKIVFVTEQEMTALNGAKDFILASKKYNIPSEKLFMVLNRYKAQTSIFNKNRIEKGLNKTVLATIPFDMDSLRDAVNTNNPVTISNPDSELARAYIDVAKIIDTKLVVPEENKGFFKLFKK